MKDNQKDNGNRNSGNMSKEKRNGGFERKNENPNEIQRKQQTPNEEVPNIGDHEKKNRGNDFDKKGPVVKPNDNSSRENGKKNEKQAEIDRDIENQSKVDMEEQPEEQEAK